MMGDNDDNWSTGRSLPGSVRRGASPESTLTPSSSRCTHQKTAEERADIACVNSFLLSDLADIVLSPVKRMDPLSKEELYDKQAYKDNPGASDSEDEDEVERDLGAAFLEASNDRDKFDNENQAALLGATDLLETYNKELTREEEAEKVFQESIPGAPPGWHHPGPPTDWVVSDPKVTKGEPDAFDKVDNPGNWSRFAFAPKFTQSKKTTGAIGKYVHHCLPTGATPVPENVTGKDWSEALTFIIKGGNDLRISQSIAVVQPWCVDT